MKNPPRPRRQRRAEIPSGQAPAGPRSSTSEQRDHSGTADSGRQHGVGNKQGERNTAESRSPAPPPPATGARERHRRERYAGQGAQLARQARERKARGTSTSAAALSQKLPASQMRDSEQTPRTPTTPQAQDATPTAPTEPLEQPRSRTKEQGQAIRRMRTPLGADDAAEILGPREESPQEASVERIEERLRARKRLTSVHIASAVGAVLCVLVGVWVVFFSALFALSGEKIQVVTSEPSVPAEEVHARVAPYIGTPLTRLSSAAVEESIEGIPQVKEATVVKHWPNGVEVTYTLRTPVLVTQVEGALLTLDEDGVELSRVEQRPVDLPLVLFPDGVPSREQNASGVGAAWNALTEDMRSRVESLTVANHQLTIALEGGRQVRWGTLTDHELKARVLQVLVTQREAKMYDVSSPTSPVTAG